MLAQIVMPLAIPISNPFPVTLGIGVIGLVVFGGELAMARRSRPAHTRLDAPLAGCLVVAAMLVIVGASYAASSPAAADPVFHLSGARNPVYDLYRMVWAVNILAALLIVLLALTGGALLFNRRRRRPVSAPAS